MIFLVCQHCKRPSAEGAKFCSECGQALPRQVCPACNAGNDVDATHCSACGVALQSAPIEDTGTDPGRDSPATETVGEGPTADPAAESDQPASPLPVTVTESNEEPAPATDLAAVSEVHPRQAAEPAADPAESPAPPAVAAERPAAAAEADQSGAAATSEEAAGRAVTALRAAVMPLQQLADRGDLRPTLSTAPAAPEPAAADMAPPPVLDSQIIVPAAALTDAPTPGTETPDFHGGPWPEEPPTPARRALAGPFFVGLGAVAVVAFAAMAFLGWSSSKPAVQANKRTDPGSMAAAAKTPNPTVDAAADAAAEAAARLLAAAPERAASKPDGRTTAAIATNSAPTPPVTPTRDLSPARPPAPAAAVAQARAPTAPAAMPASPAVPSTPRLTAEAAANAGLGTPGPTTADAPKPRVIRPTPPPALPRECTAAMDALGLCQTSSKPSGS
ncbi:MAG: zinc ribbon domain-containing protein [Rubrivivax sp.]|nr:zinc ribbon domain-containing protein [Rubrivivax sp.]